MNKVSTKQKMIEKEHVAFCRTIIEKMVPIADRIIESGLLNLPPQSYTAKDIHRLLLNRRNNYLDYYDYLSRQIDAGKDVDEVELARTVNIKHGIVTYCFPAVQVFQKIMMFEKGAKLTARKKPFWTVGDTNECIAHGKFLFPTAKFMRQTARMLKKYGEKDNQKAVLSLRDGNLRGVYEDKSCFKTGGYMIEKIPYYRSKLSYAFSPAQLEHIYGVCEIMLFGITRKGPKADRRKIRLVIRNKDGWETTSTVILPEESSRNLTALDKRHNCISMPQDNISMPPSISTMKPAADAPDESEPCHEKQPSTRVTAPATIVESAYPNLVLLKEPLLGAIQRGYLEHNVTNLLFSRPLCQNE